MIVEISKQYSFDAAHQLPGHNGKCANLHGHTYTLTVKVSGTLILDGSSAGMVMDYHDLDGQVKPIVDMMDHKFLNDFLPFRTTAENLAAYIWGELHKTFVLPLALNGFQRRWPHLQTLTVTLQETPKTAATVTGDL